MSDLLKQAIADAKAVRATALSNAKAALEEHFAPKLQSMLSEKLKAEVAAEEEGADEALPVAGLGGEEVHADAAADAAAIAPEAGAEVAPTEEIPMDAPMDAAPVGSENPEAPIDGAAPVEDPSVTDEVPVDEDTAASPGTAAAGNVYPGYNLSEAEKASSDYKKTTKGAKTDDKGQEIVDATKLSTKGGPKNAPKENTASSNFKTMPKGNQVKNIKASGTEDPQGASNEVSDGPSKSGSTGTNPLKENDEINDGSLDEILKELEASVQDVGMEDVTGEQAACAPAGDDQELDLNELLSEDDDADDKEEKSEKKDDDKDEDLSLIHI